MTVDYTTADGSAQAGSDYVAASGTLTLAPGVGEGTVTITLVPDMLHEPNEWFEVVLSNAVGATIFDDRGVGTIVDDDPAAALSVADAETIEGDGGTGTLVFPVTLSAPSGFPVTVGFATASGSAAAPGDFTAASGTLSFPAGAAERTVDVVIVRDLQDETDETFTLGLSSPTNATLADATAVGPIRDDDAPGAAGAGPRHALVGRPGRHPGPAADADPYRSRRRRTRPTRSWWTPLRRPGAGPLLDRLAADNSTVLQPRRRWAPARRVSCAGRTRHVRPSPRSTCACAAPTARRTAGPTTCTACAPTRRRCAARASTTRQAGHGLSDAEPQAAPRSRATPGSGTRPARCSRAAARARRAASLVLNTSTLPGLAGQSGSLTVTQRPLRSAQRKAVALEPATGFSFDSPLAPRPR